MTNPEVLEQKGSGPIIECDHDWRPVTVQFVYNVNREFVEGLGHSIVIVTDGSVVDECRKCKAIRMLLDEEGRSRTGYLPNPDKGGDNGKG